jgi:hypothetical protein
VEDNERMDEGRNLTPYIWIVLFPFIRRKRPEQGGLQGHGVDNAVHSPGRIDYQLMDQN